MRSLWSRRADRATMGPPEETPCQEAPVQTGWPRGEADCRESELGFCEGWKVPSGLPGGGTQEVPQCWLGSLVGCHDRMKCPCSQEPGSARTHSECPCRLLWPPSARPGYPPSRIPATPIDIPEL